VSAAQAGIPAFNPQVTERSSRRKEVREFNENAPMELAYKADFAIVKAWKGDEAGNLILKEREI
jgi:3-oxoacid CoA-transferase subunit A